MEYYFTEDVLYQFGSYEIKKGGQLVPHKC